jgi:hypothetical protein
MRTLNINDESFEKLMAIKNARPQDSSRAQTFDYILRVFEESPLRIKAPGSASPIIDADNLRIVTPTTMAEKLYSTKLKQDALKAANAAPIKNNSYQESKE